MFHPWLIKAYYTIIRTAPAQTAAQTAAQGAAETAAELAEIDRGSCTAEDGERALVRGVNAADGEAGEVPAAVE